MFPQWPAARPVPGSPWREHVPRPAIEVALRVSWLWLVGMQQGGKLGLWAKLPRGSRQALCLCCGAPPWKEKLKLSKCHPCPPHPHPTIRNSEKREGGCTMTTPPASTVVKACLCSILSPGSPGSWETPAPSAPSPDPAKSGSASSAPLSSPGV